MRVPKGAIVATAIIFGAPAATRAAPPLYETVATRTPRAELSKFLVAHAEAAAKARDFAHAIPLYQALAAARGPASAEQRQLANLWALAGQRDEAVDAWNAFADATTDEAARRDARAEVSRLQAGPDRLRARLVLAAVPDDARRAVALGRSALAAKHYGDALVAFHMAYALSPDQPGLVRELGAAYDKLGAKDERSAFYERYLVQHPLGATANEIRAELAKEPGGGGLGTLTVASSLPCTELWINREKVTGKLSEKGLPVAPGLYKGLCFAPKYEMALFQYATVEPGKPATMTFRWAIVENRLDHPYGRIAIENPEAPGTMIDLGITSPEVGVALPADGHKLQLLLEDDTGTRTEKRTVAIEPGQRFVVRW